MDERILVVDDTPANIQLIASLLHDTGYVIEVATSGKDALESLDEESFDLVMLDVMMPDMDGYETCRRIKKNPKTKNTPVIFLTAKTEPDDITKGFNSGGVDYITKPFNAEELLSRVKTHLELKKHREELEFLVLKRTVELDRVNKELEIANANLQNLDEAKNEFINIISHEIRTPLNGILGPIQLMNMDQQGEVSMRMKILNESVERLERFSHKMILMSELRTGRYVFAKKELQILPVLNEVLNELEILRASKGIEIVSNQFFDLKLSADEQLFRTLLINIVENSLVASDENQRVIIENEKVGDNVVIRISDEAGGIDVGLLSQIFKPFTTGGKFVNRNMGIGLYLSKLIVDAFNGSINVENVGTGLVVTLELNA